MTDDHVWVGEDLEGNPVSVGPRVTDLIALMLLERGIILRCADCAGLHPVQVDAAQNDPLA